MFVPTYQGLTAKDFFKSRGQACAAFPMNAPRALRFYRARNAIYFLFKELRTVNPRLTVLAPDYYSGNEVLAMEAAGVNLRYYPIHRNMQADPVEIERLSNHRFGYTNCRPGES